jgi:hypothetical protein
MKINVALHFLKGYIGHPYWPERGTLIDIQKEGKQNSRMNDANKAKALSEELKERGLTLADYKGIEVMANREFVRASDVVAPGVDPSEIVLPPIQLEGMMANAADICPSNIRVASNDQIRTMAGFGPFRTGKTKADGVWTRAVPPKGPDGKVLSNQRGIRNNEFLRDFTAEGELTLFVEEKDLATRMRTFLSWAGPNVGMGACRKMGWGRFTVTKWEVVP